MEKLFNFEKTKNSNASKLYRFQCDCLEAGDAMDIEVEDGPKGKWIMLCLDLRDVSFWQRIKDAWAILRGNWKWREFIVREEDHQNLADIFDPNKKYEELS